jgi:hypothetical protein
VVADTLRLKYEQRSTPSKKSMDLKFRYDDLEKMDFRNESNRLFVAQTATYFLVSHYNELYKDEFKVFVNRELEIPLRKDDPRFRLRGPPNYWS